MYRCVWGIVQVERVEDVDSLIVRFLQCLLHGIGVGVLLRLSEETRELKVGTTTERVIQVVAIHQTTTWILQVVDRVQVSVCAICAEEMQIQPFLPITIDVGVVEEEDLSVQSLLV